MQNNVFFHVTLTKLHFGPSLRPFPKQLAFNRCLFQFDINRLRNLF